MDDGPEADTTETSAEAEPLDSSDEAISEDIAFVVLAAMTDRMHARRRTTADDPGHLDVSLGAGDDTIYVVDDGPDHCMVGRPVGRTPDGCLYVLVARVALFAYEQLRDGEIDVADALSDARDVCLCAVYALGGAIENIALVSHYRRADRIPASYRPGRAFIEFTDEDAPGDD